MPNPVIRGFANVARFQGRDRWSQFWPYAGVATALYFVVGWAVLIPIMWPIMGTATPISEAEFSNTASRSFLGNVLLVAAFLVLLAAAVVRRLHDSGRSGFWGLMPVPFATYSSAMMGHLFAQFDRGAPDMRLFLSMFLSNILYMVGLVTLIVFLSLRSSETPNKYGERL